MRDPGMQAASPFWSANSSARSSPISTVHDEHVGVIRIAAAARHDAKNRRLRDF